MKKTVFKKSLSILLSLAMIMTCFVAMPAMAAFTASTDKTTYAVGEDIVITGASEAANAADYYGVYQKDASIEAASLKWIYANTASNQVTLTKGDAGQYAAGNALPVGAYDLYYYEDGGVSPIKVATFYVKVTGVSLSSASVKEGTEVTANYTWKQHGTDYVAVMSGADAAFDKATATKTVTAGDTEDGAVSLGTDLAVGSYTVYFVDGTNDTAYADAKASLTVNSAPTSKDLVVDANATPDANTFNTIQAAVDAVDAEDYTITVKAGTYNEEVHISGMKNFKLIGEDGVIVNGSNTLDADHLTNAEIANIVFNGNGDQVAVVGGTYKVHDCEFNQSGASYVVRFAASTESEIYNNKFTHDSGAYGFNLVGNFDKVDFYNNIVQDYYTFSSWSPTWTNSNIYNNTFIGGEPFTYLNGKASNDVFKNNYVVSSQEFSADTDNTVANNVYGLALADAVDENYAPVADALIGKGDNSLLPEFDFYNTARTQADIGAVAYDTTTKATLEDGPYYVGGTLNVNYKNAAYEKDWAGIYNENVVPGGGESSLTYAYVTGLGNGTISMTLPSTPGKYEVYFMANDGFVPYSHFTITVEEIPTIDIYVKAGSTNGNGEEATPYATISEAIAAAKVANKKTTNIIVGDGTYKENLVADMDGISIKAAAGATPVLNGTVTATGVDGFTFEGFKVSSGSSKVAVTVANSKNVEVNKNEFRDCKTAVAITADTKADNTNTVTVYGNKMKRCATAVTVEKATARIMANVIYDGTTGVKIVASSDGTDANAAGAYVVNNTFYNNSGYCVDSDQPDTDNVLQLANNIYSRATTATELPYVKIVGPTDSVFGERSNIRSDYNLYDVTADYDFDQKVIDYNGATYTLPEAGELPFNFDGNSYNADRTAGDPNFTDAANGIFLLGGDTDAADLGARGNLDDPNAWEAGWMGYAPIYDLTGTAYTRGGRGWDQPAGAYDIAATDTESAFLKATAPVPTPLTDFTIDTTTVAENVATGTKVGTFSETAPVSGKTYTYALAGDYADNAAFTIDGANLKTAVALDFETKASYTIGVTISDGSETSTVKEMTITVTDVAESTLPTFALNKSTIAENATAGTIVGTFTSADTTKTYTYALAGNYADNAYFTIDESGNLKSAVSFDYETKNTYVVGVTISDGEETSEVKSITVSVTDVAESTNNNSGSNSGSGSSSSSSSSSSSTGWTSGATYELPDDTTVSTISDIASHWAKSYIETAMAKGIISGYTDNTVRPDNNASRAEVATMIVRLLGYNGTATEDYSDVDPEAWYGVNVSVATAKGLMNGYGNDTFKPNATITREEAMVVVYNAILALNGTLEADTANLANFNDGANVSSWAQDAVSALVNAGIVSGSNGMLNPKANITRAELCVLLTKVASEYIG